VPSALLPYALLDLGCFLENLLLALVADGLGGCPQASITQHPQAIRQYVSIPEDQAIVCGVSFGVPDKQAPDNQCRTRRVSVAEVLKHHDG